MTRARSDGIDTNSLIGGTPNVTCRRGWKSTRLKRLRGLGNELNGERKSMNNGDVFWSRDVGSIVVTKKNHRVEDTTVILTLRGFFFDHFT